MTKSLTNKAAVIAGAVMTIALACTANADPGRGADVATAPKQIAAAPATVTLPNVVVRPTPDQSWYYDPYTARGHGPRPGSMNTVKTEHYRVPAGYDDNSAMHPYTSGHLGPCPQGGQGPCERPASSHYETWPFNR